MRLLGLVWSDAAPPRLRTTLSEVEIPRQVWVQHFHLIEGEKQCRGPKDRPPNTARVRAVLDHRTTATTSAA
ncbi:hypothetical protein J7E93_04160 [Streptomyces sp. ISL-36]|uniref:hypothetical protein n=1 Tax=Streptomyces sp. ISL-36 TaxID=2819182 RepID=UPI001BEAE43D|nr:hypothetical protein [Streptomyces sp. ISL-36]